MAVIALLALGCGDSSSGLDFRLATVDIVDGDDQSGIVGRELPEALRVVALNGDGSPLPGQVLNFRVVSGGGSVFAGAASTNADGVAQERWTLGTSTAEAQRVEVRAVDPETGEPIVFAVFDAIPLPDAPTMMELSGGNGQQGVAGTTLSQPIAVRVKDQFGNPVPAIEISWSASGESAVVPAQSETDEMGVARTQWTIGTSAGSYTATATASGLGGSPVLFQSTAIAGLPVRLSLAVAPSATIMNYVVWPQQPVLQLHDEHGNAVPQSGVNVIARLVSGDGTLEGNTSVTTNAEGAAAFHSLSVRGAAGAKTVSFDSGDLNGIAIDLEQLGGVAVSLAVEAGNNQLVEVGNAVPIVPLVKVLDEFGNPVVGASVTFSPEAGSGSVSGGTQSSDDSGLARLGSWTLGPDAGAQSLMASSGSATASISATAWEQFVVDVISARGFQTCALTPQGKAYCWGNNSQGGLGDGTTDLRSLPVAVATSIAFDTIVSGVGHTCGLSTGVIQCWGANQSGQIGDGTNQNRLVPVSVSLPGGKVALSLATGFNHTCAVASTFEAYCWGLNSAGQIGDASLTNRSIPTAVSGPYTFVTMAAGRVGTCGLAADATGYCWGSPAFENPPQFHNNPRPVPDLTFEAIEMGSSHSCGIVSSGAAYCWGSNIDGQLGDGTFQGRNTPTPVLGNLTFNSIALGDRHTCGIATNGAAYCWGANEEGQLGDGTFSGRTTPVAVLGGLTFQSITAGSSHSCGVTTTGIAYCWGSARLGQLGTGTAQSGARETTPVKVRAIE